MKCMEMKLLLPLAEDFVAVNTSLAATTADTSVFNTSLNYGSILVLIISLMIAGCVEKFTPEIHEPQYRIVVNGLITNQPEVYTVRLSWTIPFGGKTSFPMAGCNVTVHDDLGHILSV